MIGSSCGEEKQPTLDEACSLMARVVKEETGHDITSVQIKEMFERRWQRLSALAHNIHGNIVALKPVK